MPPPPRQVRSGPSMGGGPAMTPDVADPHIPRVPITGPMHLDPRCPSPRAGGRFRTGNPPPSEGWSAVCGIVGLFSKTGEAEAEGGRPLGDVLVEMCQDLY